MLASVLPSQHLRPVSSCSHSRLLSSSQSNFCCGHRLQHRQPVRILAPVPFSVEAAHKKGGGSTKNGRDSKSKRRGVKVYGGQPVKAGGIIVRQVGSTVLFDSISSCLAQACTLLSQNCMDAGHSWRRSVNRQGLHPFCIERGHCPVQENQVHQLGEFVSLASLSCMQAVMATHERVLALTGVCA